MITKHKGVMIRVQRKQFFGLGIGLFVVLGAYSILHFSSTPNVSATTAATTLSVKSTLNISFVSSSNITVNLAPVSGTADFKETPMVVYVNTNNQSGYSLLMSTGNYNTKIPRSTPLADGTTPTIDPIPFISGGYTAATFESSSATLNKWGYRTNVGTTDTNYFPVSASDMLISRKNVGGGDYAAIFFGAKVDTTQPSGIYSTTVNFTAIANPAELYYLQDVATWENMLSVGETITAVDNRTGFSYDVIKLGANYLWMKSNLKLPAGTVLTSANSDVTANFTLPTEAWTSSSQNYYCKAIMAVANGEYYYNWYAAKANPYVCSNPTASTNATATNDAKSLGSICPKGWTLPASSGSSWYSNNNQGALAETGLFYSGVQAFQPGMDTDNTNGFLWFRDREDNEKASILNIGLSMPAIVDMWKEKNYGLSVRCERSQGATNQLVVKAGEGIEAVIVADSSSNYEETYATPGSPAIINNTLYGGRFTITVIPRPGYILDGWTGSDEALDMLDDQTLLTTGFNMPTSDVATLTANGVLGSYTPMSSITSSNCPTQNVTDFRNQRSYTIWTVQSNCYMQSDLMLEPGITLTSSDSDIKPNETYTTFTTPTEAWTSSSQNYYCKAIMAVDNHRYYYNWYAAKANPYVCSNPTASTNATGINDAKSLGSICPKGWTLPNIEHASTMAPDSSTISEDIGKFGTANGYFINGSRGLFTGTDYGYWWLNNNATIERAYSLALENGQFSPYDAIGKLVGHAVRCVVK